MFIVSVTAKKLRAVFAAAAALLLVGSVIVLVVNKRTVKVESDSSAVCYKASTSAERLAFISQFGWLVDEEPAEVREIVIPTEFDDVYNNYNAIQLSQQLDLSDFCGKRVKRWSYIIRNYPGYSEQDDCVRINMLVYDGCVIGGDVCSTELDGFMHGFYKEELNS